MDLPCNNGSKNEEIKADIVCGASSQKEARGLERLGRFMMEMLLERFDCE